mmetsp:Transcript_19671/g.41278  ORF Transcript_19671/g.41278 Transcript_19671/m.41278 type:complete len:176 (+) Transcript_19671:147-674(+)|eukprot:CAMPEP_0171328420 /NCGR_PEP_ID=MMETSP0878-20121228/641_1 /TAXON_ID=67004 /ORGANISM="Thalassiosira weissflogii, Strain CCMP1336" /LENGTH=175 /DNA_ID=CAMNT_0011828271 /DNA_START=103 /DNA_END=630 /DNA_ORIENTATION=-
MSLRGYCTFASIVALLSTGSSNAFAPSQGATRTSVSSLNLVPEQGRQLVAFSQAYLANKAKESASKASNLTSSRRRRDDTLNNSSDGGRGRSILKNVTRLLGVGGETRSLQPPANPSDGMCHDDDEVVYPIVGFKLVDGHALSTTTEHASCSLHLPHVAIEEEVVGWYRFDGKDI